MSFFFHSDVKSTNIKAVTICGIFTILLSYSHKNIGRENKNVSFRDVNHKRFAIYYCNVDVKDIIETCTFAFMHFEYHSHRSFLQIP